MCKIEKKNLNYFYNLKIITIWNNGIICETSNNIFILLIKIEISSTKLIIYGDFIYKIQIENDFCFQTFNIIILFSKICTLK